MPSITSWLPLVLRVFPILDSTLFWLLWIQGKGLPCASEQCIRKRNWEMHCAEFTLHNKKVFLPGQKVWGKLGLSSSDYRNYNLGSNLWDRWSFHLQPCSLPRYLDNHKCLSISSLSGKVVQVFLPLPKMVFVLLVPRQKITVMLEKKVSCHVPFVYSGSPDAACVGWDIDRMLSLYDELWQ
jgi:hypothetical protein